MNGVYNFRSGGHNEGWHKKWFVLLRSIDMKPQPGNERTHAQVTVVLHFSMQKTAYSGTLLMLFSKPKFLAETRMA